VPVQYHPVYRQIWSLSGSGSSTTISGAGNSGAYSFPAGADYGTSPVDLGEATDVGLFVYCGTKSGSGSPSLTVSLDLFAAGGQLFPAVISTAAITAAGAAAPVFCGLHGPTTGTYVILPHWGRVSWALSGGGNFSGVEISLMGR
jgi:hypothetical protein